MLPMAEAWSFSVLRRGQRHASLKALPKPLYILGGVMVSMQARTTVWARMPADGQALLDDNATARTRLARVGGRHRYDPPTGACCLVGEDAQERRPSRIADAFGEMVILDHVGRLQVFMIDRVAGLDQAERRLVVEVLALAFHLQVCLGQQLHRLASAVAALRAPGHAPLQPFQVLLGLVIAGGGEDVLAIGECGKRFEA